MSGLLADGASDANGRVVKSLAARVCQAAHLPVPYSLSPRPTACLPSHAATVLLHPTTRRPSSPFGHRCDRALLIGPEPARNAQRAHARGRQHLARAHQAAWQQTMPGRHVHRRSTAAIWLRL